MARATWTRLGCHSEHVENPGAQVPALCRLVKHRLCQKLEQGGLHDRQQTLGSL